MSKKRRGLGRFLFGAGVGVGLGMLLSKNTGKENREALKKKAVEFLEKIKSIDSDEVKSSIQAKVDEIMVEISDLDKEKAIKIAKKKAQDIKHKSEELVEYVIEKGTPALENAANTLKEKAIDITKQILNRLEQEEK